VAYDPGDWRTLLPALQASDVVLVPGAVTDRLAALPIRPPMPPPYVVVDGYDPLLAEWLALPTTSDPAQQGRAWAQRMRELSWQYTIGDFYLCASERQRDWWLGLLEASGRINPATVQADPSLRTLIDVLPFGLPSTPPQPTRPVIKGVWPGIGVMDKLLLWGGGLWPWLDPVTAIRAVAQVWPHCQAVKLVFPGSQHPNPAVAQMPTALADARRVAEETGLLDRAVFFGDWLPYADWPNVLLESDLALSLHFDTLETRLAFRSRILEYIWAGLPMVVNSGDATSDLVTGYGLGVVTAPQATDAVASAIHTLLAEPRTARQAGFVQARQALTWERAAAPLIAYCRQPWAAADRRRGLALPTLAQHEATIATLTQERDEWRALAQAYERGRFMRLMNWLKR
jgi:hypothetical protein